jgi:tRNA(Arg) A34 adenosine deaminase TadA
MTHALPESYTISLPAWLRAELPDLPAVLPGRTEQMELVHALARRNFAEGNGGPFAAIVVERATGRLVSAGVNVVLQSQISSSHAEVVALGLAQTAVGSWNLRADGVKRDLIVNWRPCVQCYGATFWSGAAGLVIAGSGSELEEITTFDEGPVRDDWREQLVARGMTVESDVLRDEAIEVFTEYRHAVDAAEVTVYNAAHEH